MEMGTVLDRWYVCYFTRYCLATITGTLPLPIVYELRAYVTRSDLESHL